ncbi:DUF1206 domain-containing protein [Oceaniglobus indicus]|uniref:DUF1206 domain-containing protein n=1 Tax=Oceaniglobus indicus TaxID=2047749 RepID=UPI000C1A6A14|nr:DUF1206 domain-containing protein [Oceaniglobus indicus]
MDTHTDTTSDHDFGWAVVIMRAGYLGRALVYLAVAGISLWAIATGGQASGTSDALSRLEDIGGIPALVAIALGMLSYAIWRLVDALYDLEDYGSDGEGIIARLGMLVTGIIHLAIGFIAAGLIFNTGSGGGSSISKVVSNIMDLPGGRWIVGVIGLIIVASGIYYIHKGWTRSYRKHLRANTVTRNAAPVLTAGVIAQGVIVGGIGGLFVLAAVRRSPGEAGGMGKMFNWAYSTPFGATVVIAICIGLLGFALFCVVNAIWRIVPKADDSEELQTLSAALDKHTPDNPM